MNALTFAPLSTDLQTLHNVHESHSHSQTHTCTRAHTHPHTHTHTPHTNKHIPAYTHLHFPQIDLATIYTMVGVVSIVFTEELFPVNVQL